MTRKELDTICKKGVFGQLTLDENKIYCDFCNFVELDLHKQLETTGDYKAPDDFYLAYMEYTRERKNGIK